MPGELIAFGNNGLVAFGTAENELLVHARTIEEMLHANSHDGQAWTMPFDARNPDATDKIFGYIQNGDGELNIHLRHFAFQTTVAGFIEIIRVTGTAAGGSAVTLTNENHNNALDTPEGTFEAGADITGLTDGGKHEFLYLETGKVNRFTVNHDIVLGKNGAVALNWVPSTGILTGKVVFYTHVPGGEE